MDEQAKAQKEGQIQATRHGYKVATLDGEIEIQRAPITGAYRIIIRLDPDVTGWKDVTAITPSKAELSGIRDALCALLWNLDPTCPPWPRDEAEETLAGRGGE